MKKVLPILIPLLTLLCSCEDEGDDYRYPSVITDFVCFSTDAKGQLEYMHTDKGDRYTLHLTDELLEYFDQTPSYRPDTVYRAISIYELIGIEKGDTIADIYSIEHIVSEIPTPLRLGETLRQDPVYLQSCWLSGGYMNMVIELKALNGSHTFGFIDTTPEGMKGKEFTLYHDAHGDIESYRQKLYASIPLFLFEKDLQQDDTIRFVANTYDKGISKYEFGIRIREHYPAK